jgi:hypothetical protein
MAVRFAVANGNWSNTATWNGGTLPTSADDVYANNFTVTIDGTFTVLTIRNTSLASPLITAGGGFTFSNGGNLTCTTPINGLISTGTVPLVTFNLPSGQSATLNASCDTVPSAANGRVILIQNTGTFNIVGDYSINNFNNANRRTINIDGSTTVNIVGNITSLSSINSNFTLVVNSGNPTINIIGNVSGGTSNALNTGYAIICSTFSTINITGNITTNSCPSIAFPTSGVCNVIGNVTGGNSFPAIFNTTTACTIDITGVLTSGDNYPAIQGLITTLVILRGNIVNTNTYAAIYAGRVTIDDNVTSWQYKDSTNLITRTLYTPGVNLGNPAITDVRDGVTYASGALTGTLDVPPASSVAVGVPVDSTVGTAIISITDMGALLASYNV